jgi:hypothetical protein
MTTTVADVIEKLANNPYHISYFYISFKSRLVKLSE